MPLPASPTLFPAETVSANAGAVITTGRALFSRSFVRGKARPRVKYLQPASSQQQQQQQQQQSNHGPQNHCPCDLIMNLISQLKHNRSRRRSTTASDRS
jgi:hypothetical protein